MPYVFTENGVAMLSSVLSSEQAIQVNISIMRTFTKLRHFLAADESLADRMAKLERGTNKMFRIVFERLDNVEKEVDDIIKPHPTINPDRKKIGIRTTKKKK